jgi:hypothetical protein
VGQRPVARAPSMAGSPAQLAPSAAATAPALARVASAEPIAFLAPPDQNRRYGHPAAANSVIARTAVNVGPIRITAPPMHANP